MSAKRFCNEESLASSDSDEYHEVFYSSSSRDRSSVGSIPWAEDAIKQNQQEWERLERMFYGEEGLPEDQELRNEIIEWTTAFPHIRVLGKRLHTSVQSKVDSPDTESSDESAIENILPSEQNINKNFTFIHPEAKSIFYELGLVNLMERDLRISSVPMLSKRREMSDLYASRTLDANPKKVVQMGRTNAQQKGTSGKISRRPFFSSNSTNSLLHGNTNNISPKISLIPSSSAKIVRMPPIVNFIMPQRKYQIPASAVHYPVTNASITRRHPVKYNQPVMLPVLNLDRSDLSREMTSRSISAALNDRQFRPSLLYNSASKLKNVK